MGTIALLGRKSAGKTTFTCMSAVVVDARLRSVTMKSEGQGEDDIINIKEEFVEEKLLPPGTPQGIWNLTTMKKETFLTKKRIFYVDCAGGVQIDALEKIHNSREERGEEALKEVLIKIGEEEGGELEEYVKGNMLERAISIKQAFELMEIEKDEKAKAGVKAMIAFIKSIMDSNGLIVLVDGERLRGFNEEIRTSNGGYGSLEYYSSVIDVKRFSKVAIVISKGHLFGVNKENYRDKLEEIRRDYIEKYPGTTQLLKAIRDANSRHKLFCIGVPSAGYKCEKCKKSYESERYRKNSMCPKCKIPLREKYTDTSEIFGVKEVINWI